MNTLDEKIAETESYLMQLAQSNEPDSIRVAWTGGKDSTVVLYIWNHILTHLGKGPAQALNLDTGFKFPQVIEFRDHLAVAWQIALTVCQPTVDSSTYPVAQNVVTCCHELKIKPLKQAIEDTKTTHLITGIRRDEHPGRVARTVFEKREPNYCGINPILEWTEMDIWAFHAQYNIPYCSLYDQGYRSLGCQPCTFLAQSCEGERGGRAKAKEASMETLTSLGYF